MSFNYTDKIIESYHYPHIYNEKTKTKSYLAIGGISKDAFKNKKEGEVKRNKQGEYIGVFRRFDYEDYTPEFNRKAKEWVKRYEDRKE